MMIKSLQLRETSLHSRSSQALPATFTLLSKPAMLPAATPSTFGMDVLGSDRIAPPNHTPSQSMSLTEQ